MREKLLKTLLELQLSEVISSSLNAAAALIELDGDPEDWDAFGDFLIEKGLLAKAHAEEQIMAASAAEFSE